jgi:hypothetical protein
MISALLIAAAMFAQAAPASDPSPPAPPAAQSPKDLSGVTVTAKKKTDVDQKEVVCHSEAVLGSMFPKKVCASREAFAERRNVDQAEVRRWTALRPGSSN